MDKSRYTTHELAALAGVSDAFIRMCLLDPNSGLRGEKFGRDWSIPRSEVIKFLAARGKTLG